MFSWKIKNASLAALVIIMVGFVEADYIEYNQKPVVNSKTEISFDGDAAMYPKIEIDAGVFNQGTNWINAGTYFPVDTKPSIGKQIISFKPSSNNIVLYDGFVDTNFLIQSEAIDSIDSLIQPNLELFIQIKSNDELQKIAQTRNMKRLAAIPSIQPIASKDLKRLSSGFGRRIHPIYNIPVMHYGVDLSAPSGTPIYATGNGVVKVVKRSRNGYGNWVEIQHAYGFSTRYTHMRAFNVKRGQIVTRGQCIGYVGSTGSATAPHIHYEVLINRKPVNPDSYFFYQLNEEQQEKELLVVSYINSNS